MRPWLTTALLLSLGIGHPALAEDCTLAGLHWLEGTWRNATIDSAGEERWVVLPGGNLAGSAWETGKEGVPHFIEALSLSTQGAQVILRLRHFDGTLARAWEDKTTPVVFVATECVLGRVRFTGQGAQAGEAITYSREKDRLSFVGDFIHKGKPHRIDLEMVRAGD